MENWGSDQCGAQLENRQGMRIPDCKQTRDGLLRTRRAPGNLHILAVHIPNSDRATDAPRGSVQILQNSRVSLGVLVLFPNRRLHRYQGRGERTPEQIPPL